MTHVNQVKPKENEIQDALNTQKLTHIEAPANNDTKHANISRASTKIPNKKATYIYTDEMQRIKKAIDEEIMNSNEMDNEISELNSKILSYKKKQGGINASKENYFLIQKQIHILENRLGKANQKFSESVATNKHLRNQIENLRKERCVYQKIFTQLNEELKVNRKNMAEIINNASKAQTERGKAQEQLTKLIENAKIDQQEYNEKLQRINEVSEKAKPLEDMIKSKEAEKTSLVKQNVIAQEKYEEAKIRKKELMSGWGFGSNITAAQTFSKKIQTYEEIFTKIQSETSITDIDQLVQNFMQCEEKIFYLYKFVNDLNKEIQAVDKNSDDLRSELESYNGKGITIAEAERQEKITAITSQIELEEIKAKRLAERESKCQQRMNLLKENIYRLYTILRDDDTCEKEIVGSDIINSLNVFTQLEYIEKRKADLIISLSEALNANKEVKKPMADNVNINDLLAVSQGNESVDTKDYLNKIEPAKCKVTTEDLLNSANMTDFRNKIVSKLKSNESGNDAAVV